MTQGKPLAAICCFRVSVFAQEGGAGVSEPLSGSTEAALEQIELSAIDLNVSWREV